VPRRIFPASSVTNTTGAPVRLSFHYTQTGGQRASDLFTVDGSNYTSAGIPNGTVLTDASGNYSAFAGPDDVDTLWVAPHTGAARTQITATGTVANGATVDSSTYVPKGLFQFPAGRVIGWAGASITNGSSSSNASATSFRAAVAKISGSARVSNASINGGVAGERSDQIAARVPGILTSGAQVLVLGPDFGTNGAGASRTLAQFQADTISSVTAARAANVPVVICTTIPRGSSAGASVHTLIQTYNLWLRAWAPTQNIPLAECWGAVVDRTTGYLGATYDSGDGTHPNDAGHLAIAQAIAPVIAALITLPPWPAQSPEPGIGLIANPLMDGAGSSPTGWGDINGTFTGPTYAIVNSTGSDGLPAGRWASMRLNGSGTGNSGFRNFGIGISSSKWAVGDKLLAVCYAKASDAGGAALKVQWLRESTAGISTIIDQALVSNPGPIYSLLTVPSGVTGLYLALTASATTAQDYTIYLGACQVYNLTALGLASAIV
jgi:lysophospholipase L1-like esterase